MPDNAQNSAQAPAVPPASSPGQGDAGGPAAGGWQGPAEYYFLSRLLGARVRYEDAARPFGRLTDVGVSHLGLPYPVAVSLNVRTRKGPAIVAWEDVRELSEREFVVRRDGPEAPKADFWLRRDVLDDQVVDVSGAKVHRVNDIHVLYAEGQLLIAHVEVGLRSILRRIGAEGLVQALTHWLFDYTIKDAFVSWRSIHMLAPDAFSGELRATAAPSSQLAEMNPAEMADILEHLGRKERQTLFRNLSVEAAAEALQEVDPDIQRTLLAQEGPDKVADILQEMPAKEAAAVLRDYHDREAETIMSRMESGAAEDVQTILAHHERTAGAFTETSCIEARPDDPAGRVLEHVRQVAEEVDVYNYIYVLGERRRLLGIVSLRELLCAPADRPVKDLMTTHIISLSSATRVDHAARVFAKYGFRALPVLDERGAFQGAVRLISVLQEMSPLFEG